MRYLRRFFLQCGVGDELERVALPLRVESGNEIVVLDPLHCPHRGNKPGETEVVVQDPVVAVFFRGPDAVPSSKRLVLPRILVLQVLCDEAVEVRQTRFSETIEDEHYLEFGRKPGSLHAMLTGVFVLRRFVLPLGEKKVGWIPQLPSDEMLFDEYLDLRIQVPQDPKLNDTVHGNLPC